MAGQSALDPAELVFVDETWAKTNRTRARGGAPPGERLVDADPDGHWHTTAFVGAGTARGFVAPMVVGGVINGDRFRAYVEKALVFGLRPGDMVVLDNLGCHTVSGVREAVQGAGGQLRFLPPYSPNLNPIENDFKGLLRKATGRTVEGLWAVIGRPVDRFLPGECLNHFRHCGHAATPTWSSL